MVPPCASWKAARGLHAASPHSPPSSQLVSGRECAGVECGHMGWPNHYSGCNYQLVEALKSSRTFGQGKAQCERDAISIWGRGPVVDRIDVPPRGAWIGGRRFVDGDDPVDGVARGVEAYGPRQPGDGRRRELGYDVAADRKLAARKPDGAVDGLVQDRR